MSAEEEDSMELPEELKKLEIENLTLPLAVIKMPDENLPVSLNPFFYQAKLETKDLQKISTIDIFGPKCSCEIKMQTSNGNVRRRSSSTGSYTAFNRSLLSAHHHDILPIERTIINQTKFKSRSSGTTNTTTRKKFSLKDPVLKKIRNCLHAREKFNNTATNNINNILLDGSVSSGSNIICQSILNSDQNLSAVSDCPNLDNLELEDETSLSSEYLDNMDSSDNANKISNDQKEKQNFRKSEFLDFRNLIEECELISNHCNFINPSGSNRNVDLKNNPTSRNFTTIQNRLSIKRSKKLQHLKQDSNFDDEISDSNETRNNINSNEGNSLQNSNTPGTSCSQQARINPSTNCDVTIDELASYFETFVHIPKKMSEMAEMMYI